MWILYAEVKAEVEKLNDKKDHLGAHELLDVTIPDISIVFITGEFPEPANNKYR